MINIPFVKTYKSVICLNSSVPYDDVRKLNLPIIVADGGANLLVDNEISPDYVIGDMDSVHQNILKRFNCIHIDDQNSTDFDKAIKFAQSKDLLPCVVAGIDGGFFDHSLNNFSTFVKLPDSIYLSSNVFGFCISNCTKNISLPLDTKISIFGAPTARITTNGLKWELIDTKLSFFSYNSSSNRTVKENIEINVSSGTVFVLVYRYKINDAGLL